MKIVIFNDNQEVVDTIENVIDAEPLSLTEVRWRDGGATFTQNYIIIEDTQNFEEMSDEEIFAQRKYQTKLVLARKYEDKRIEILASGTETEEKTKFDDAWRSIDTATNNEELHMALINY